MIEICSSNQCTSCAACANVCPKQAITMAEDKVFGHYRPMINQQTCVDCGLCQNICPQLYYQELTYPRAAYAAWSKDKLDYHTSTSGGASSVIASYTIEQGGVVYGCAITPPILQPKHIRVDDAKDLYRIKGSKYVQCKIDESLYKQIKQDLKDERRVVFLGTPCQNAGLRAFLRKDWDSLLLVDIICHGVPSWKMLKEHLENVADLENVSRFTFRSKKGFGLTLFDNDGVEVFFKRIQNDNYYLGFIKNLYYGDVCYKCKYARPERIGDITIGDFWGLGKLNMAEEHDDGISIVLLNSNKGLALFDAIKDRFYYEKRSVQEGVNGNKQLRFPSRKAIGNGMMKILYHRLGFKWSYRLSFGVQDVIYKLVYWVFQ